MLGHKRPQDLITEELTTLARRSWRRHSADFKTRVIEPARQPGVSTAGSALVTGHSVNMLRRWVREAGERVLSNAHKDMVAAP